MNSINDISIINNMNQIDFLKFLNSLNTDGDKSLELINNSNIIENLDLEKLKVLFLKSNNEIKIKILEKENLFYKIIKLENNKFGRSIFELIDDEIKLFILNNKIRLDHINPNLFFTFLKKLPNKTFDEYTANLDVSLFFKNVTDFKYYLKGKYEIDEELAEIIINKCVSKKLNIFLLLQVKNKYQLMLFNKFNLFINAEQVSEDIIEIDGYSFNLELINKINDKHIRLIRDKLIEINSESEKSEKIAITAIKMYMLFGFDNSMKILNNKFTNITELSVNRAAEIDFIDKRRQYRLEHQDRFFHHEMIFNTINAAKNRDFNFFKNICHNKSDEYISILINNLIEIITLNDEHDINNLVKELMQNEVQIREENFKIKFITDYFNQYSDIKRDTITINELYLLFKDTSINELKLDNSGRPILNDVLLKFLLGNAKTNNDCILRLVLNNLSLGLNKSSLTIIINNFKQIEKIIQKSSNKLSINSVLDIINISKAILYNLAPNEQDMSLETVTKILNSAEYCGDEPKEEIFKRSKELHLQRLHKISSSIPFVGTHISNGIRCSTFKFNDPTLITCGIDTGSCLKVGAKGEDFLKYCLTSPNSVIIGIWDENKNFYICPFVRNGNALYGNGIDPKPKDEETATNILNSLANYLQKIISSCNKNDTIDFATITDLKMENLFASKNLSKIKIDNNLAIDATFYSDYHKEEITNYVIATNGYIKPDYYTPKHQYYQPRIPNYNYILQNESDKERIELLINSIYYDNINHKNLTVREKKSSKRNYQNLKIENYKYIIGNKDWFIAIDDNDNIISCCLPYDERAKYEYLSSFQNIKDRINDIKTERIK